MWLSNPTFLELVKSSWDIEVDGNPQNVLAQKLQNLKKELKVWDKHTFGKLQNHIVLTENQILEFQKEVDTSNSLEAQ